MTHQAVTRKLKRRRVGACRPLLRNRRRLHDPLALEQAARAFVVQIVQSGIDFSAHGIGRNGEPTARPRPPRGPRASIERRCAHEGDVGAAGKTLCRRYADTHARERTRTATHQIAAHVPARHPRIRERRVNRLDQLDVRPATTCAITRGQHLDTRPRRGIVKKHLGCPPCDRASEHVRGRVHGDDQRAQFIQLHLRHLRVCTLHRYRTDG